MGQDRVDAALGRIEQAIMRLEAVERAPANVPAATDGELEELRGAYRTLRGKVEGAVGELDRLLMAEPG
jgi:hypothetical protein